MSSHAWCDRQQGSMRADQSTWRMLLFQTLSLGTHFLVQKLQACHRCLIPSHQCKIAASITLPTQQPKAPGSCVALVCTVCSLASFHCCRFLGLPVNLINSNLQPILLATSKCRFPNLSDPGITGPHLCCPLHTHRPLPVGH